MTPASQKEAQGETGGKDATVSRWRLKHTVAQVLRAGEPETLPGVCKCGTAGFKADEIGLTRRPNGKPGVSGVLFCDSAWLCPTCAPRRAAQRAERVGDVFDAVEAMNGRSVFVTLTVRHDRQGSLADLKKLVDGACRKARQGRPWALAKERYGIAGTLVSPEVTWSSRNGWHYHLHLSLIVMADSDVIAEEAGEWLIERYMSYIRRDGGRAERQAQDVQVIWRREDAADYVAKGSAAWEVSNAGATKKGKGGLTPWDLAASAGKGSRQAAALFREYADVMPGTRACVITAALAERLGIAACDDEDEPGEEPPADDAELVGTMTPPRWHRLLRRGHAPAVLQAVSDGQPWAAIDALVSRLMGEDEDDGGPPLRRRDRPPLHAPTAAQIARSVLAEAHQHKGLKGAALLAVLDRERTEAAARGHRFAEPNLRRVLELVGA